MALMKSETNTTQGHATIDNELDIRGLCCVLWRGKFWITGIAILFAVVALGVSFLIKQEWSSTAITDRPTVNNLSSYFSQAQFLRNLDMRNAQAPLDDRPSISEEAYTEFVMQLAAYDTRRDFWLHSPYYQQRKEGDARANAALLDDMVNDIQFTARDALKVPNDSVKLTAETSADANKLLREYVNFASRRAAQHLFDELQGAWAARTQSMKAQVKRQEAVAQSMFQRQMNNTQQALKIAQQQNIKTSRTDTPAEQLPNSDMFLLGVPMLQARAELLQASGPSYDLDYDQNRAMLSTLSVGPILTAHFQTYRYLRTPEEPVKRDSPRRAFLMIMWGVIGGLVGAGIALAKGRSRRAA